MNTKIIAVVNQKGGSGKTTILMQLAAALVRDKYKVLIVDADPQGTATGWAKSADDNKPFPVHVISTAGDTVHVEVKQHVGKYDYIFIDCPPAIDHPIPQAALIIADVALIPIALSPADLLAANGIQALIFKVQQEKNKSLKAYIVPNMMTLTKVAKVSAEYFAKLQIKTIPAGLSSRTAFKESVYIGGTVFDLKGESAEKAQAEVIELKNELLKLLKPASNRGHK